MHAKTSWSEKNFQKAMRMTMFVLGILACMSLPIHAQSYRGAVHGVVRDTSGGVVVGLNFNQDAFSGAAPGPMSIFVTPVICGRRMRASGI